MAPDIDRLLRALRVPDFEYRDPVVARSPPARVAAPRPGVLIVAIASLLRGVGRTMLAANLASAVGRRGVPAVAIDLDPRDGVRLHFRAASAAAARALDAPVQSTERCVGYVPFGRDPAGVIETLAGRSAVVFLDTPAEPSPQLEQALAEADEVLVPVRPDPSVADAFRATEALLARWRRPAWRRTRARYLVNQLDARRDADREALATLRALAGSRLLWPAVQQDEAVRAALARGRCVHHEAPGSQVVADLAAIALQLAPARARALKDDS